MKVLIIITIIGFLITIFNIYLAHYLSRKINNPKQIFSLKETMAACNLPIVSFSNNGQDINFIIDTGATDSLLNKDTLNKFIYTDVENSKCSTDGIGGNMQGSVALMKFTKEDKEFNGVFQVMPIPVFQSFKEQGIEIHGLLGNNFLRKYQFKIDYTNLKADLHN